MDKNKKIIIGVSVMLIFVISLIGVYAVGIDDIIGLNTLNFEVFINSIPIIGNILVPDDVLIADELQANQNLADAGVALQESLDRKEITEQQFIEDMGKIEDTQENNNDAVEIAIGNIVNSGSNLDVTEAATTMQDIETVEPLVSSKEIISQDSSLNSNDISSNDLTVSDNVQTDSAGNVAEASVESSGGGDSGASE